jgi:hypothetical protein
MVAPLVVAGIGAGVSALGGLLGEWWGGADDKKRQELLDRAQRLYGDVSAPTLERLVAEEMPSDFGNRDARNAALRGLVDEGLSGGNSFRSQLELEGASREAARAEASQRAGILQRARSRGVSGQADVLAQLGSQQAGADRARMSGLQSASDARSRALAALAQGGTMAANAEAQDFDRAQRLEESRQHIAAFNAGQRQNAFNNQLAIRDRQADALYAQADEAGGKADRRRRIGEGVGDAANRAANLYAIGQAGRGKP